MMAGPSTDAVVASLPIVDAHHHVWDVSLRAHPWLTGAPLASFRYGDYAAIRRTYLPADYRRDTARFNVVKTVYVEAEWDQRDPIGETRWVHETAAREGLPHAMVAQAWLDRIDAAQVLAEQAAFPLVRSVRHKPKSAATAPGCEARRAGLDGLPEMAGGLRAARQAQASLRPADAVVAPRCRGRAGAGFSSHHHHPQPHRSAGRPQPRGSRRLAPRHGATGA